MKQSTICRVLLCNQAGWREKELASSEELPAAVNGCEFGMVPEFGIGAMGMYWQM